ncbi:MAG TPA: polysaccharide lyase [Miltoncostaeaceae bacterium]|nr:polysaccharide lyase [Miltoncostaeaceae bacterium]
MPPPRTTLGLVAGAFAIGAFGAASLWDAPRADARLTDVSFEAPAKTFAGRNAEIRSVGLPTAPDGRRVAHVAASGSAPRFSIHVVRNLHLPRKAGRYAVSAYVRAAAATSVGKPVLLQVVEYGRGPTRVLLKRGRLTGSFSKLVMPFATRGRGRKLDIIVTSAQASRGDAFLVDDVVLTHAPRARRDRPTTTTTPAPKAAPPVPGAAAPNVPPGAASPIGGLTSFRGDWETGDASQWGVDCVASDRLQIVTSPVRQGRYAARFEVRPGDKPSSAGERCEVHRSYKGDESAGQAYYYAWSTMVPVGWVNPKNYGMFVQFHTTWPYPPTLEITTQFGEFYLLTRGGDRDNYDGRRTTIVPTLSPGKWNDFAMYVKWGVRDGAVKIWHRVQGERDFKVVFDQTDVPTVMTSGGVASKLLLRHGYYRGSGSPGTAVVYQDGMRRGATLADVMADFPAG